MQAKTKQSKIYKTYIKDIIKYIKKEKPNKTELSRYKIKLCSKHHIKRNA